jgi:hypothetical protein
LFSSTSSIWKPLRTTFSFSKKWLLHCTISFSFYYFFWVGDKQV